MEKTLVELIKENKLYGYQTDCYNGGKGIVVADNEEEATEKLTKAYLEHGYESQDLTDLEVWKIDCDSWFSDAPDVLEVC